MNIDINSAAQWADTFEINKSLVHLDLSHNILIDAEIKLICKSIHFYWM